MRAAATSFALLLVIGPIYGILAIAVDWPVPGLLGTVWATYGVFTLLVGVEDLRHRR